MFALLKNEKDKDGRTEYLIEAKRMGIPVKLPHINDSDADFKIEGKDSNLKKVKVWPGNQNQS
jgi:DNA polymerase III alpha subunit